MATVTIGLLNSPITEGNEEWVTLQWDEDVTDFEWSEITVTGANRIDTDFHPASSDSLYYTRIQVPFSDATGGRVRITVAADAVDEGNSETTRSFDWGTGPSGATFTITTDDTDIRAGEDVTFTITSDIDTTGFFVTDITVTGGTRGNFTATGTNEWELDVEAGSAGTLNISIPEDSVDEGNDAVSQNFTVNALPTVSISSSITQLINDVDATLTFEFDEDVGSFGFTTDDITLSTGTKGTFTAVDGDTFTLVVTPPASGTGNITVTVAEDALSTGFDEYTQDFAYGPPPDAVLDITVSDPDVFHGESVTATFTFTSVVPVTGFTADDITISAGTKGTLTQNGLVYTMPITAPDSGSGTITISVAADVVTPGNNADSASFEYLPPGVPGIPTSVVATAGNEQIELTWEPPTDDGGATITDYEVRIGTAAWIPKGASARSHTFTNLTNGTEYTVEVRAENSSGHGLTAERTATPVAIPSVPTSVSTSISSEEITLTWEPPTDTGGTAITDYEVQIGSGSWIPKGASARSHTFTGLTNGTEYTVRVRAENSVGYSTAVERMATPVTATLDITLSSTHTEGGSAVTATFTFSGAGVSSITGFTAADVSISDGTKGALSQNGLVYTMPITAPTTGTGTITVSVAANVVTPGNNADSASFTYTEPISIEMVDVQNIVLGTENYELELLTTGITSAMEIKAIGDWEDFYHTWNQSTGVITIRAEVVEILVSSKTWRVDVVLNDVVVGTGSVDYNIVAASPVIQAAGPFTIYKGVVFSAFIPVSNVPTETSTVAELIGMNTSVGVNEDGDEGVLVEGVLPIDADLDVSSVEAPINVSNSSGSHTRNITFDISTADPAGAPSNVVATAGLGEITLTWEPPTSITAPIIDYEVRLGAGEWIEVGEPTRSHTFTGLNQGQTYTVYVRAETDIEYSAEVSQTVTLTGVPGIPNNVFATEGNRQIELSWLPPTSDGGSPITDYEVKSNLSDWISRGANARSYTFTGLTNGTQYTVSVRAENSVGYSAAVERMATPSLSVPGIPTHVFATVGHEHIELTWQPPADDGGATITDYEVQIGSGSWIPKGASARSHTFTGLTNGTEYTVRVRAENSVGYSTAVSRTSTVERSASDDFNLDSENTFANSITFANNKFWVVDISDDKVYTYTSTGGRSASDDFNLDSENMFANSITFANNKFWVVDISDNKVYAYTSTGGRSASDDFNLDSENTNAYSITFANNKFWVMDIIDNKVYTYTSTGGRSASDDFNLDSENTGPTGITFANNKFWVVDSGNDKVYTYTSTGGRSASDDFNLDSENTDAAGITFANNKFWVVDISDDKVYSYDV